jgi:hypothetical protein
MNERRLPRFTTRLPVRYQIFDGRGGELRLGRLDGARTRDLGSDGLFLAYVDLPVGTRLHFYCELPERGCFEAFGVVSHQRARLDAWAGETPGVGVRFTRLSPHARARLDQWLDERRAVDEASLKAALDRARAEVFLARMPRRLPQIS